MGAVLFPVHQKDGCILIRDILKLPGPRKRLWMAVDFGQEPQREGNRQYGRWPSRHDGWRAAMVPLLGSGVDRVT
jgi:hypothetical protein